MLRKTVVPDDMIRESVRDAFKAVDVPDSLQTAR
jgi:hypothetical protein